jgi:hypothetical protein
MRLVLVYSIVAYVLRQGASLYRLFHLLFGARFGFEVYGYPKLYTQNICAHESPKYAHTKLKNDVDSHPFLNSNTATDRTKTTHLIMK